MKFLITSILAIVTLIIIACLCPLTVRAIDFDEMLLHRASKTQPFWGYHYKNIKWVKHTPDPDVEFDKDEADFRGQIDIGKVDLDGDKKDETIKVTWSQGVSDHSLVIELYKDEDFKELIDKLEPIAGIQPNFKIEDVDNDGGKEIIIWSGLWDFRIAGEDGVTEETYEGHSAPHRYIVATYKLLRGEYYLWDIYTTKKKYEPFCEQQPRE